MKFKDWSSNCGIKMFADKGEFFSVLIDQTHKNRTELWHLSDAVVTSANGPVIWLRKKDFKNEEKESKQDI